MAKAHYAAAVDRTGRLVLWVILGLLFLGVGLQMLTPYQAAAVRPYASTSPLLDWCYRLWGGRGASAVFGLIQIPIGLGLLSGLWRPGAWPARLATLGATLTAAITASFLITAPYVVAAHTSFGAPLLSLSVGQFFAKDVVLLAGCLILVGESFRSGRR